MQNSMVVFIASVLRWKYSLWASFVQKMKIVSFSFQKIKTVSWSWNLEPRLIWIFKIWRWFSFYSFLDWKYSFWVNLAQKIKIVSLSWNLVPRLFWIIKFDGDDLFSVLGLLLQVLFIKSIWHFDVTWWIFQWFICKNLKPVAFII